MGDHDEERDRHHCLIGVVRRQSCNPDRHRSLTLASSDGPIDCQVAIVAAQCPASMADRVWSSSWGKPSSATLASIRRILPLLTRRRSRPPPIRRTLVLLRQDRTEQGGSVPHPLRKSSTPRFGRTVSVVPERRHAGGLPSVQPATKRTAQSGDAPERAECRPAAPSRHNRDQCIDPSQQCKEEYADYGARRNEVLIAQRA